MLQPKPTQTTQTPSIPTYNPVRTVTAPTEQGAIGRTIVIKGEVSGSEPLYIDGCIEGKIHFADHRVTIGRHGTVAANIDAKEVVIMGSVKGNIHCTDRVDIRAEGTLTGDVVTRRISVEDGAVLKGSVQVQTSEHRHDAKEKNRMPELTGGIETTEKPKALTAGAGA